MQDSVIAMAVAEKGGIISTIYQPTMLYGYIPIILAEKLKLLKEKQGILPCYAIRVEKHQKHPVVFEKAPVLF